MEQESKNEKELEIAKKAFKEITDFFPHLKYIENYDEVGNLEITFPVQDGLVYEVWLNNQNIDELHFSVCAFWMEWFPCTDEKKVIEYKEAVIKFISGDWRVVEFLKNKTVVKAKLQKPTDESWKTIACWAKLYWPTFKKFEERIIQNKL